MTSTQLYRFIENNSVEWRYQDNQGEEDVLIFPRIFDIDEFYELLDPTDFDDGGIECTMMDGYFAFWMKSICEANGIDLEEVFEKES